MARGKQTCKLLKEIRRQIAAANDIEFVTSECRHKGDCLGTCPKCEAEVRYLEQQLRTRSLSGRAIALAGISAGMILMSGCNSASSDKSSQAVQDDYDENYVVDVSDDSDENFDEMLEGDVEGVDIDEINDNLPILIMGEVEEVEDINIEHWVTDSADTKPQFPGGLEAMERFINEQYPTEERADFSKGRISFCVDCNGDLIDKYAGGIFSKQLFKIIEQFPTFTPAEKDGQVVPVYLYATLKGDDGRIKIDVIYYSLEYAENE